MASQDGLREVRHVKSATFQESFSNAAAAGYAAGAASKPRIISLDTSGLTYEGVEDASLQGINHKSYAPHEVDRSGVIKFDMYGEGAYANITSNPVAALLGDIMGGITNPATGRTDAAEAAGSSTVVNVTSHGQAVGTGVLCGARGDDKGDGEFRILVAQDTNTTQ